MKYILKNFPLCLQIIKRDTITDDYFYALLSYDTLATISDMSYDE